MGRQSSALPEVFAEGILPEKGGGRGRSTDEIGLVQPFWILPALALSKLKLKDIMGYTVIMMFWVGIIYIAAILLWGYLG
ncbi:TIGR00366 family protein [Pseudarthrobacter sp. HLT3-5]|uniref:TIGR00366 family protein n=1 Tax=Pseudarthrobacter cellobiosi TaxID=2953654 RepID=UPI00208E5D12|nr:TIGR00366 family protein [Pseudarthrobacter sp. HLT3-5]MCO4275660.1 TIGR00366 family protein [Pseudarthrobacter sp. HLT3-5]